MFTGYSHQVREFDKFVSLNYGKLSTSAEQVCWNDPDYQDILQNNLIKVRERISRSGFTSSNFFGFVWMGISNDFKTKKKKESRKIFHDVEDRNIQEDLLTILEGDNHDSQKYYDDLELFTKSLFNYIEINYPKKKATLFKTYYLTNANTYQKLAEQSGLSEKYIKDCISSMKKDLRLNLLNFINSTARVI